ncbi:fungal specific transcription factor, partial [Colletotrichum musicola]
STDLSHIRTRCDRQQPCSNCSTRGQPCVYPENQVPTLSRKTSAGGTTLQGRLAHLERLVRNFGQTKQDEPAFRGDPKPGTTTEAMDVSGAPEDKSETGSMRFGAFKDQYVGGDHWAAILDSIADLKDHFDREEHFRLVDSPDKGSNTSGAASDIVEFGAAGPGRALLLYGCQPATSREEIVFALPPKEVVDHYVSRYFHQLDLVASCKSLHPPTSLDRTCLTSPSFRSWSNIPSETTDLSESSPDFEREQRNRQIILYREKTVQCLMMGNYTQGGKHVLETFLNYVYIEFRVHTDAEGDLWYLLGIEVNLAKRMGYHRDPKHFPNISPLEGEMRRRVWATVLVGDSLLSGQMGMPRMITNEQFDTEEPRNLNDSDLEGELSELPPGRPETEETTSLGLIARRRILVALGAVSGLTSSLAPYTYEQMMKVDSILNEAQRNIPPPLQMKPMSSSVTDSPQTIMARLFLGHMFYKGQIMLHRRFLFAESSSSKDNPEYSRTTCLNAALESMRIQQILDEETRPGGQLQTMHWRVGSIMNHHFLTATMILCAMLYRKQTLGRDEDIMQALRGARSIFLRNSAQSKEAKKAERAVSLILARAGAPRFDMELQLDPAGARVGSWHAANAAEWSAGVLGDLALEFNQDDIQAPGIMNTWGMHTPESAGLNSHNGTGLPDLDEWVFTHIPDIAL